MKTIPSLDIDPFTDEVLTNPIDFQNRVREAGPAVKVAQSEGFDVMAVGRDRDVRAIFPDYVNFPSSRGGGILDLAKQENFRPPGILQETDPPYHDTMRKVMSSVISPRHLRVMRERFQAAADELVDRLLDEGEFDAQTEIAEGYPLQVIPDSIMGVRPGGRENLLRYSTWLFESMGPMTPRAKAVLDKVENLQGAIDWVNESTSREYVEEHSLGHMLWEAVDEGRINEQEAGNMVRTLVGAGIDTTIYGLGFTLNSLLTHPAEWAKLRENPDLGKFAFEEGLRLGTPVRQIWHTPAQDLEIDGVPVRGDQKVMLVMGAANRDPETWGPDADAFDITRDSSAHLSLGRGIHACAGAPLARLEADILLSTLARKVRSMEPTGDPVPFLNNTLRGWASIPMKVHAA